MYTPRGMLGYIPPGYIPPGYTGYTTRVYTTWVYWLYTTRVYTTWVYWDIHHPGIYHLYTTLGTPLLPACMVLVYPSVRAVRTVRDDEALGSLLRLITRDEAQRASLSPKV